MRKRSMVAAGLFACLVVVAGACAQSSGQTSSSGDGGDGGDDPSGSGMSSSSSAGGAGGMGGMGGMGGEAGMGGAAGMGGGGPVCGNNIAEEGEACDGVDFAGKTCESLGLGGGQLKCNAFCSIVASSCFPTESCNDGQDNDQDFLVDCQDDDCSALPTCLDSCASPQFAVVPGYEFGDTTGRPDVNSASCAPGTGPEMMIEVVAPTTGNLAVQLSGNADYSLSVRTACADPATELLCVNNEGAFGGEVLSLPVVQGQTYYVMIDGTGPGEMGYYDVYIDVPFPESDCYDIFDNDADGMLDCDDPDQCQTLNSCTPGAKPTGAQCFSQNECFANTNDPICLPDYLGYPDGYCSEFCDMAAPDCGGDAVCADIGLSLNGVCLDGCLTNADCRLGYACVDKGLPSMVCSLGPEMTCDNFEDDDFDDLIDCQDPSDCQLTPSCASGPNAVGQPCTQHNQCSANMNDPYCISDFYWGWPQGYCSEACTLFQDDCGSGATCIQAFFQNGDGMCFDECNTDQDCRLGYFCNDFGNGQKVCIY